MNCDYWRISYRKGFADNSKVKQKEINICETKAIEKYIGVKQDYQASMFFHLLVTRTIETLFHDIINHRIIDQIFHTLSSPQGPPEERKINQ